MVFGIVAEVNMSSLFVTVAFQMETLENSVNFPFLLNPPF